MITVRDFLKKLLLEEKPEESGNPVDDGLDSRLQQARQQGWVEDQDIHALDEAVDRRTAARILHMYRRKVLGISDVPDISQAYNVRDLFDCRVCANHIAQMVLQGIMEPVQVGDMTIFDVYRKLTEEEAESYIDRAGR
jgi:hypothetical protein